MAPKLIPGGLLIAIEGIDGAGKTTLARGLADAFSATGAVVSMSKEPTAGQYGKRLRESAIVGRLSPDEEVRLLLLDRREHVETVIKPSLARGEIVILDRYYPSMVAYQGAAGVPINDILLANAFAPKPDLLVLLDLDPLQGLTRIHDRGDTPNEFEDPHTLELCRRIFLKVAEIIPGTFTIDAREAVDVVLARAQTQALLVIAAKMLSEHGQTADACKELGEFLPSLRSAS